MIELLGIAGGISFAISGIPAAIDAVKKGKNSLPVQTAWLVFSGAIVTWLYLFLRNGFDWIITVDYLITVITWAIVLRYHYFPIVRDSRYIELINRGLVITAIKEYRTIHKCGLQEAKSYMETLRQKMQEPNESQLMADTFFQGM